MDPPHPEATDAAGKWTVSHNIKLEALLRPKPFHPCCPASSWVLGLLWVQNHGPIRPLSQPSGLDLGTKKDGGGGDSWCSYRAATHIPSHPLLTDAHFKCLVVLEKGKTWKLIFWDRNIEFTILCMPMSGLPSCQEQGSFLCKTWGCKTGFLKTHGWIKQASPAECRRETWNPMAIKLKIWKFH